MKKLMATMMAALLVLSLAACGGKADASGKEDAVPENLDLNEVYQALMDLQPEDDAPVMLPESNPEIIDGFYPGLSDITLKQQVFLHRPRHRLCHGGHAGGGVRRRGSGHRQGNFPTAH